MVRMGLPFSRHLARRCCGDHTVIAGDAVSMGAERRRLRRALDLRLAVEDLVDAGAGRGGALGEPDRV